MNRTSISNIVAHALQVDSVDATAALGRHPRWDSLGHLTIISALEAEFGIELTEDEVGALTSLERLKAYFEGA